MEMIEVTNLTKRYGGQLAVDHISFCVEKGQIYGLLGPNGAGKSTTMNIIIGRGVCGGRFGGQRVRERSGSGGFAEGRRDTGRKWGINKV